MEKKHIIRNLHIKPELRAFKDRNSKQYLKKYNLTGIGIGVKKVGGHPTDRLSLVMFVEKKLSEDKVPKDQLIPKIIDGFEVDVIETGKIRAMAIYEDKIRPAVPGYSVGHPLVTAGTFGCIVYKNSLRYLLSNNHVIANKNVANVGDLIYQPGVIDGGVEADAIASLSEWIPLVDNVNVDCAIAEIIDDGLVSDTGVWGGTIDNYTDPELYDVIFKTGRTTGTTYGILEYEHADFNVNYGDPLGVITITDCFGVWGGNVVQGGDSGSCARINNNIAVGLVFAGGSFIKIFNYMSNIVEALQLDLPYIVHPAELRYGFFSQEALSPNTMIDDDTVGTVAWSNPDNAKVSDNQYATVILDAQKPHYLKATNFGFSIPDEAIIANFKIEVECKKGVGDGQMWGAVYAINPNGSRSVGGSFESVSETEIYKLGSRYDYRNVPNDTEFWIPAWISSSNFGALFCLLEAATGTVYVDHIRMTVYYVVPDTDIHGARARIKQAGVTKTVQTKGRILHTGVTKTVQAKGRILQIRTETIQAKSRIFKTQIQTAQAKADIKKFGVIQIIQTKGRIKHADITKTIQTKARIKLAGQTKTIQARARMKLSVSRTVMALARIIARSNVIPLGWIEETFRPSGRSVEFVPTGEMYHQLRVPTGR